MRGRYHEINDNGVTRYFEIHTCPYSPESVERLRAIDCLEQSALGQYMRLIQKDIPEDTLHLYKLQTYVVSGTVADYLEFRLNSRNFEQTGFLSIDELLAYCKERWGITASDFKPEYETSIP
jgi:hypothetical protein